MTEDLVEVYKKVKEVFLVGVNKVEAVTLVVALKGVVKASGAGRKVEDIRVGVHKEVETPAETKAIPAEDLVASEVPAFE